jgi:hypothetical protein
MSVPISFSHEEEKLSYSELLELLCLEPQIAHKIYEKQLNHLYQKLLIQKRELKKQKQDFKKREKDVALDEKLVEVYNTIQEAFNQYATIVNKLDVFRKIELREKLEKRQKELYKVWNQTHPVSEHVFHSFVDASDNIVQQVMADVAPDNDEVAEELQLLYSLLGDLSQEQQERKPLTDVSVEVVEVNVQDYILWLFLCLLVFSFFSYKHIFVLFYFIGILFFFSLLFDVCEPDPKN